MVVGAREHYSESTWKKFARATIVDAWLTSLIVFELLIRCAGHYATHELVPYLLHLPHLFVAFVSALGRSAPETSCAPRTLTSVALMTAFLDALAVISHANVLTIDTDHRISNNECLLLASVSLALTISSVNIYWAAAKQRDSFSIDEQLSALLATDHHE